MSATLLPNGEQNFFNNDGEPLAAGKVFFYIPTTETFKLTWQDSGKTILNTNPVILDASGRAIIYGSGVYRQIVKDSLDNVIWDQLTASTNSSQIYVGGQSGGSANAQTLAIDDYDLAPGNLILFTSGFTNTTATTLNIEGTGAVPVTKLSGGVQVPLVAGDLVAGQFTAVFYDGTSYQLVGAVGAAAFFNNPLTNIASAATTDIGSTDSTNVQITGTTTILSLGASANVNNPLYFVKFSGALTLTHNAVSLILPGGANITTAAGDTAFALYLGSGNWQLVQYTVAASGFGSIAGVLPGAVGLLIANNAGSPNTQMDISANYAVVISTSPAAAAAFSAVSVTVNFATTGLNGLDAGAIAASTWYYLYLISNGSGIGGLASLSATAPTLPVGYTLVTQVGACVTDGSANLFPITQKGEWTQYGTPRVFGTGTIAISPFVPPTATRMQMSLDSPNAVATQLSIPGFAALTGGQNGVGAGTGNFANLQTVDFLITSANVTTVGGTGYVLGWKNKVLAC